MNNFAIVAECEGYAPERAKRSSHARMLARQAASDKILNEENRQPEKLTQLFKVQKLLVQNTKVKVKMLLVM